MYNNPYYRDPYTGYEHPAARLARLEQQAQGYPPQYTHPHPQQYQQPQPPPPQPTAPAGSIMVSVESEQEARSAQLDITGNTQYFIDPAGKIYTKKFDPATAGVLFEAYEKVDTKTLDTSEPDKFDTMIEEIHKIKEDLLNVINDLKERFTSDDFEKALEYAQSKPSNGNQNFGKLESGIEKFSGKESHLAGRKKQKRS